jgi:UDP-4-amino-4-deoxy-L-arabinose formyltransferase / UDP-glucuronic acid dehydrogenase (UDP-4-keto-hexauronic acid decarboxylating)
MKTVLLAYHEIGCVGLEFLKQAGAEITAVFTHEDDPGENVWFGSVAQRATDYGLRLYAPAQINDPEWVEAIRACEPDVLFSFYYRKLVSANILAIPPRGCYNLHGSLLPRFRGRSPTNWAILLGEKKTGVTLHEMVVKADAGVIIGRQEVDIEEDDDARMVLMKQAEATRALLAEVYPLLLEGRETRTVQDESLATKFGGRRPEDGIIDWNQSAESVHNLVRAVAYPWPGAFTTLRGQKCMIWRTRRYRGPVQDSVSQPGAVVGATSQGVLVVCDAGCVEVLRAQIPPGPWLEGEELKELVAPIPGPGFSVEENRE